ncbi:MAG: hypothetical protein KDD76_00890, partial [Rickettsiales bacterium]|nr:hypothetical protein [Rickettsiales bacterium]
MKRSVKITMGSLAIVIAFFGLIVWPVQADEQDTLKQLDLFGDVFEKVREEYVEEPVDSELIESAINGMLTSL